MSSLIFVESTDGTYSFVLKPATLDGPTATVSSTDLKFYGSGTYGWENGYSQNFFRLLENFACEEKIVSGKPVPLENSDPNMGLNKGVNNPVIGQAWFNKTRNQLFTFDGTDWVSVNPMIVGVVAPVSPALGQLWFDTTANYTTPVDDYSTNGVLKMYNGASFVDVAAPIVDTLYPRIGGTVYGSVSTGGETAPDVDAGGICINHGANDGKALSFKNSDVSHSFTGAHESDTYGYISKVSATEGGMLLSGLSENFRAVDILGYAQTPSTSSIDAGVINVRGVKQLGVGTTSLSSSENLLTIQNSSLNRLLLKGNGDLSISGEFTATGRATAMDPLLSTHLTTKNYVDTQILSVSTLLFEPTSGNWHNNGFLKVHTDGGTEVGSYIDWHAQNAGTSDRDIRMDVVNSPSTMFRMWGTSASEGTLEYYTQSGQLSLYSNVSGSIQTTTFLDRNIEFDAAYPGGHNQKEYMIFGKIDNTKGGARIRSYVKNGTNQNFPGLLLESIKADDGQTPTESGIVTLNAAKYVGGSYQLANDLDNIMTVTNHMSNRLVTKGNGFTGVYSTATGTNDIFTTHASGTWKFSSRADGTALSNTPVGNITDPKHLTTKEYVDAALASTNYFENVQNTYYTFWTYPVNIGASVDSGIVTIQNHPLSRTVYVNAVTDIELGNGEGNVNVITYLYLYRNGVLVDSNTSKWAIHGIAINTYYETTIPTTVSDNGNYSQSASAPSYEVKARVVVQQSTATAVYIGAAVRVNSIIYR